MRIQVATFAMAVLALAPFAAAAEREPMAPGNQVQGGMRDSESQAPASQGQTAAEDENSSDVVEVEIVAIEGDNLIAEADSGEEFVLLVGGSADDFNVGDELQLRVDDQEQSVVILNVIPQDEGEAEEETES